MQNAAALMDGFDMDIDSSGEKVSNAELAAVLAERWSRRQEEASAEEEAGRCAVAGAPAAATTGAITASGQRGRSAIAGGAHE